MIYFISSIICYGIFLGIINLWNPSLIITILFYLGGGTSFFVIFSIILKYFPKKKIKNIESQVAILKGEIPLLEMELELRKSQFKELKKDKTKELEPTNEIIS